MKSLFESISELNVNDSFELHFKILGLTKGYELIDKLECEEDTKKRLIQYTNYAYSYESPLLKKHKDRFELKTKICEFVELEVNDFVLDCIRNQNAQFVKFITWYLREAKDRDSAIMLSLEDSMFALLELAREGINFNVTASSAKDTERALKIFVKNEVLIKGEAINSAMKLKSQIESLQSKLEKNYEYLYKAIKTESQSLADNIPWPERMVLKRRQQ